MQRSFKLKPYSRVFCINVKYNYFVLKIIDSVQIVDNQTRGGSRGWGWIGWLAPSPL